MSKSKQRKKGGAGSDEPQTLKDLGNRAFVEQRYDDAIRHFTAAIEEDPTNAVLYSNRSAVHSVLNNYELALQDADAAIQYQSDWSKPYIRKAAALEGLMQLQEAKECYDMATKLDVEKKDTETIRRSMLQLEQLMKDVQLAAQEAGTHLTADHNSSTAATNGMNGNSHHHGDSDKFDILIQWLRTGNAKFPYLYLKRYDIDYRGVHAITHVGNNRIILEVPLSHIMTSELAKSSDIGRAIITGGCELNSTHSYLACYLLQERKNLDTSYWKPYIETLPQHYRNMPIFFHDSELALLKGSFTLKKIQDRKDELLDEYNNISKYVPTFNTDYTLDEFIWARLVVITRIFGLVINNNKTDGLVPMADMLNHKRPRETSWTFDQDRGAFTITTLKSIDRGEQIYDSYGRKCNSRFFVNYGFALEHNEEDNQAVLFTELPQTDPNYQLKLRLLGGPQQAQRRRWQIPCDYSEKIVKAGVHLSL